MDIIWGRRTLQGTKNCSHRYMYTKINIVPEFFFFLVPPNLSIVRCGGSIGKYTVLSEVLELLSNTLLLPSSRCFYIRLYIIIFTRWSCLYPRAREIILRGGRIPTTRSRSSSTSVHVCDVANDDRCVDETGVGDYVS